MQLRALPARRAQLKLLENFQFRWNVGTALFTVHAARVSSLNTSWRYLARESRLVANRAFISIRRPANLSCPGYALASLSSHRMIDALADLARRRSRNRRARSSEISVIRGLKPFPRCRGSYSRRMETSATRLGSPPHREVNERGWALEERVLRWFQDSCDFRWLRWFHKNATSYDFLWSHAFPRYETRNVFHPRLWGRFSPL